MEISKLAQARIGKDLTQAQVAEKMGVDVGTVSRWEKSDHQPYLRHLKKLCDFFEKSAHELGLAPSKEEEAPSASVLLAHNRGENAFARYFQSDLELRLQYIISEWVYSEKPLGSSSALLQRRLSQELEDHSMNEQFKQNHKDVDMARRAALQRLALFPIHAWGLDALNVAPRWTPEDILPHCAAGITACEDLSRGQGEEMSLAYGVLSTYLPPLKEIVEQVPGHRQEAAQLVAQALLIKATLSVHREGPKRAANYGKQAVIYSKESEDTALQLTTLKRLAWMYACDKQGRQALETVLQAKSLLQKYHKKGIPLQSIIQSSIFGGVAEHQARNGQDKEALTALDDAKKAFFAAEQAGDNTATYLEFNSSEFLLDHGLTYYHLEQYEKALEVFAQAVDPGTLAANIAFSSERTHIEIINNETLASLKSPKKDMELSIRLWKAGIQGAIDLRSEQRFGEALTAYDIMQALWHGEKSIKELRELIRHW
jgi:transcriptional regulator with XRE-family HTH domain